MFRAEFLHVDGVDAGHCHAATITARPAGGLVAAWYVYPERETVGGRIVLARCDPACGPWTRARLVDLGSASSLGNPVVFYDPNGVLWLHYAALRGHYWDRSVWCAASSPDDGRSFSAPMVVSIEEGRMVRHPPVFLADGTGLMPTYCDRTKSTRLYSSRPPYTVWRPGYQFDDVPIIQPALVRFNGRLVLLFRPAGDSRNVWRSVSTDSGKDWSPPVRLPLPNPLSGLDAFAWGDRLVAVYNHTEAHRRSPLSIAWSDGLLHHWSAPIDFERAEFEVSYPSFCTDEGGAVHGVYTYNRKLIKYVTFDSAWADGHDARD